MIVADVNVLAYLLIEGVATAHARQVFAADPDWRVPSLWRHELTNVVATYVRSGLLSSEDGVAILDRAEQICGATTVTLATAATLKTAQRYAISAYDAQYILLAAQLGVPCVTEDRQMIKAVPKIAINMENFCQHTQ